MRIIGKHKDYYDGVKAYGIDPNCVYVRKREEVKFEDIKFDIEKVLYTNKIFHNNPLFPFNTLGGARYGEKFEWGLFIVGFCGRLYPCIRLEYDNSDHDEVRRVVDYVYNANDVVGFLRKYKLKDRFSSYLKNSRWNNFTFQKMKEFFEYVKGKEQYCTDLFFENKIPTFVINLNKRELVWNEVLKDVKFYKQVDTFTAFQELAGYVSGVLGGQSPVMISIADKDMVFKKGFNDRSFRKDPGLKRRNGRKKGNI